MKTVLIALFLFSMMINKVGDTVFVNDSNGGSSMCNSIGDTIFCT